jgi:hypothetical protein
VAWGTLNIFQSVVITEKTKVKHQVQQDIYYIRIGKYLSLEHAKEKKKSLLLKWPSAIFIASKEQSDEFFEVIIGPFETKKNAQAFIKKHQLKGSAKKYNTTYWLE